MTREQRSRCMSRIRGQNTGPELLVRRALWRLGLRYRVRSKLAGRPDLVFGPRRIAVFIDGCFWHACPEHGVKPKANGRFWREKLGANIQRDRRTTATLREAGWTVLRFWEHEVERDLEDVLARIGKALRRSGRPATGASKERSRSAPKSAASPQGRSVPRRSGRR